MRFLLTAISIVAFGSASFAEDNKPVDAAGMKSTPPKDWKLKDPPAMAMGRVATFGLPPAEGDKDETEVVLFFFEGGGGTIPQNLDRQRTSFLPTDGKDKVDEKLTESKVGTLKATSLDLSGTYKKRARPGDEKFTPLKDYREVYVAFEGGKGTYYVRLLGPAKTVEKNKKGFDEWLTAFK